jgi:peroxiredoxin
MPKTLIKPEKVTKNKVETIKKRAAANKKLTAVNIKTKRRFAVLVSLCIVGLGLSIFGLIALFRNQTTYPQEVPPALSSTSVSEVSEKGVPIDAAALVLEDIHVTYQDARVIISWVTNKPASGEIEYWASGSSDKRMISSDDLMPIHIFEIARVDADKPYSYRVKSKDANGNQVTSEEETFILIIPLKVGTLAPDFTLQSIDGKSVTLSSYRGKPVMLYFWRWSCPECREKLPVIQEAFEKLPPDKMTIIAIHPKAEEPLILNFVTNEKITFDILLDQQELVKKLYKVKGLVANFFIDSDGTISKIDAHYHNVKELDNIFTDVLSTD